MTAALVDGHKWGVEVSDRSTQTDGSGQIFYNMKVVTDRGAPEGYAQAAAAAKAMSPGKHVIAIRYEGTTKLALADYVKRVAPTTPEDAEEQQASRTSGRNLSL